MDVKGKRLKARGERLMGKEGLKELRVWQKGKDLAVYIYRITRNIKYAFKIDIGTVEDLLPLAICLLAKPEGKAAGTRHA
ncbi:MAG: four helix bundle protein [Proteobacteria bacterium]|nr:four helix bundle protein [Pseudomonadota bacterium]